MADRICGGNNSLFCSAKRVYRMDHYTVGDTPDCLGHHEKDSATTIYVLFRTGIDLDSDGSRAGLFIYRPVT